MEHEVLNDIDVESPLEGRIQTLDVYETQRPDLLDGTTNSHIVPLDVTDPEHSTPIRGQGNGLAGLVEAAGKGFLDQHIEVHSDGAPRDLVVGARGHRHDHGVDDIGQVGQPRDRRTAKFFRDGSTPLGMRIENRGEDAISISRRPPSDRAGMQAPHGPGSDDGDANRIQCDSDPV
jgi:hypothetical protein